MSATEETEELEPIEGERELAKESGTSGEGEPQEQDDQEVEFDFEALLAERDELHGRWQRAQADYQNLRRRAQADLEAGVRRETQPLMENLLLVLDYLDMALKSPTDSTDAKNLATGVGMTRDQLVRALEDHDVRPVETDVPFDPEVHQAVARVELGQAGAEQASPGDIIEVVRAGFTWRFGVLRHAQVRVAAEPAAQADEAEAPIEGADPPADEAQS